MEVPPEVVEETTRGVPVVRRQDAGRGQKVVAVDGDAAAPAERATRDARRATAQASSRSEPARRTSGPPVPMSSGALRRSRPRWTNCVPWPGKYRVDIVPQCRCIARRMQLIASASSARCSASVAGEPLRPPPAQLRRLVEFGVVDIEGCAQPLTVGVDRRPRLPNASRDPPAPMRVTGRLGRPVAVMYAGLSSTAIAEWTSVVAPPTSTTTTPVRFVLVLPGRQQPHGVEHRLGRRLADHRGEVRRAAQPLPADDVIDEQVVDRLPCRLDVEPVDRRQDVVDDVDGPPGSPEDSGDRRRDVGVAGDDDELEGVDGSDGGGVVEHLLALAAVRAAAEQQHLRARRGDPGSVGVVEIAGDDDLDLRPGVERGLSPGVGGQHVDEADGGHPQPTTGARRGELEHHLSRLGRAAPIAASRAMR